MNPDKSKESIGSRRRVRLLFIALFCFFCWAAITFWNQTGLVHAKMNQIADLEHKLDKTKQANGALKLQVTRLNDPEYIEQMLRSDFQMVREGETLFVSPKPDE